MRSITFATNCWENDWDILLKTDFLKNKISRNAYNFNKKTLLINNVTNREKVEKSAKKMVAGRMLFAFSRDHGVPGSPWLRKVSHHFRTPANALVAIVVFSYLLTNAAYIAGGATAIAIVTAISTIALYWAYGVPIFLGIFGKQEWRDHAVWKLGRFSRPIAALACLWIGLISFLFLWPTSGNPWTLIAYAVFLVFLLVYYFAWARRRFKGPVVEVGEEELTEIEREFERAAEELGGVTA